MANITNEKLPKGFYCTGDECAYPENTCRYCPRKEYAPELIQQITDQIKTIEELKEGNAQLQTENQKIKIDLKIIERENQYYLREQKQSTKWLKQANDRIKTLKEALR